ncbi:MULTISPECIES: hypothetical protein [Aeribacillus]|uniref:Phage protein n=2 Tax=root TaxID=1 RepID=A0A165XWY4_9BACI|nr:hypothetical protein [Aeribacillus pallidus]KZN96489.1 hypothetical protein AZI98_08645 [Aeribacillus pallidus]
MADKVNGKITNIELEMALDDMKSKLPYFIQNVALNAKLLKAKYDSLLDAGFTDEQAMDIVKTRPLYE